MGGLVHEEYLYVYVVVPIGYQTGRHNIYLLNFPHSDIIVDTRRVPVQQAVERDEIPYMYKVHGATLRLLLNIMDTVSHNPALCATCCPLSQYNGLTRISLFATAAGAVAACILN